MPAGWQDLTPPPGDGCDHLGIAINKPIHVSPRELDSIQQDTEDRVSTNLAALVTTQVQVRHRDVANEVLVGDAANRA